MLVYARLLAVMDTVLLDHARVLRLALRSQRLRLRVSLVYLFRAKMIRIWACAVFVATMGTARPVHVPLLLRDIPGATFVYFVLEGVMESVLRIFASFR